MTTWIPLLLVIAVLVVLYVATRRKPEPKRDVARLERGMQTIDVVDEVLEPEGAPLKPHHRRRELREPRLLPKPPRKGPRKEQPRLYDVRDARRRFSLTLRSRDRKASLLVADPDQLERFGLPLWRDERDVAEAFGITLGKLRSLSMHRRADPRSHYVMFAVPKRGGGERIVHAPKRELKKVQRDALRLLIGLLPVHPAAHGFRKDRSIRTGAEPHVGKRVVLKLDIREFFPSVTFARVRGYLVAMGYGHDVATTLAVLCTEAERQPVAVEGRLLQVAVGPRRLPQGAPTSPGLSNAICMRLDRRLTGLARAHGFTYTRYADDLTFSGEDTSKVGKLKDRITCILRDEGFEPNPDKTRVMRRGRRQEVTGVTVNATLGLSRKERRALRAAIHQASKEPAADAVNLRRLHGKVAYLRMLNAGQAAPLERALAGAAGAPVTGTTRLGT